MRKVTSLLVLGLAVLLRWQDPQPVAPKPGAKPSAEQSSASTPPAATPSSATQEPRGPESEAPNLQSQDPKRPTTNQPPEKVVGKPERSPLEGVYRLRTRVVRGVPDLLPSAGYLAITGRHLFLNLAGAGTEDGPPLLHAGVREWRKEGAQIRTTAKLDYYTDGNGEIFRTPEGKQEMRRIEIVLGGVRVMQTADSWLEFERIE